MTDNVSSTAPGDPLEESAEELTEPLVELSAGPWWWVLIRGLLAVAFGVIALFSPGIAAIAIAFVFGAYAVVDGITEIAHAVRIRRTDKRWGWLLFAGIVSVIAGALALLLPVLAAFLGLLIVLWTIVFYNVVHGAMVIGSASGATGKSGRGWAIFAGVVSIVFGVVLAVLLWITPGAALLGLVYAIGIYAIAFGIMLVVSAITARAHGKKEVTAQFA